MGQLANPPSLSRPIANLPPVNNLPTDYRKTNAHPHRYLRGYWKLVALALFLAAVNQVFALLDGNLPISRSGPLEARFLVAGKLREAANAPREAPIQ